MAQLLQTAVAHRNSPKSTNQNAPSDTKYYHNQRPPMPPVSPNKQQISIVPPRGVTSPGQISQDRVNEKHNYSGQNYEVHVKDHEFFKEIRGSLMTVAILAAGSTYQAGLNLPGAQKEGNPVRYDAFFYCNGMSFISSLVIIIIQMNKHFYGKPLMIRVLKVTMVLDLFSFMAAYAAGSCHSVEMSIVIFVLVGGVFAYVVIVTVIVGLYYPVPVLQKLATGSRSRKVTQQPSV